MSPPTSADFAQELDGWLRRAEGEQSLDVRAGDLHRAVGGYPGSDARMPTCCDVMRAAMRPGDVIVQSPPRGRGASLTVRYVLPRPSGFARPREHAAHGAIPGARQATRRTTTTGRRDPGIPNAKPTSSLPTVPAGDRPVVLVSCVKKKLATAVPARDLYLSALFRGMRAYAERHGRAWFILSAKHGVLRPEERVEPYELTLATMKRAERDAWGRRVVDQLLELLPPAAPVVILAGMHYRRPIEAALRSRGHEVTVPIEGLRMGEQLRWLKAQRDER